MKQHVKWLVFAAVAVATFACTQSEDVVGPPPDSTDAASAVESPVESEAAASLPAAAVVSTPTPSPTPSPQFSGFDFEI